MRLGFSIAIAITVLLPACSTRGRVGAARIPTPEPYVRISNTDSNLVQLQIAVRKFVPVRGAGPAIWLAGVSHIGDTNYYAELQKHLDAQTVVLYEGISGPAEAAQTGDGEPAPSGANAQADSATTDRQLPPTTSLQSSLASALGLVFQLEAINYTRSNFRNNDLSVGQLRRLLDEHPAAPAKESAARDFERLLAMMDGSSLFDRLIQLALRFVGASQKLQAIGRLVLIDVLGKIQGDPSRLDGLPPETRQLLGVLIQQRNQKVVADLKADLPRVGPSGSIAVFYGTGHMPDLEIRLRRELEYHPADQLWFIAFSVNLARAGISNTDSQFIHGLVEQAVGQLQRQD